MGLLDQLAGDVLGSLAGGQGQPQAAGGGQAMLLQLVMGLLQGNQGGLGALLARLNEAGLGEQVASWIGKGQNLPVSAEQISQAFGGAGLGDMAALLGMSSDQLAGKVAELLPQVVDGLTPDGQLPSAEGTDMAQALGSLSAILGRG
ncbi:YidB family protein [Zoogloea sp.]|jgi:uncharacterized protein YidB (DUF937 family)|uniref:YidB family protein n=1 Tax=Zoogloea sp. TaxID=49181 RepID=UPI0035B384B1